MRDDLYMLMVLATDDGPRGATFWTAARVDGERALTQEQIENVLARIPQRRFVFPYTQQTEHFGANGPVPTLAIPPGETFGSMASPRAQTR